MDEIFWKNKRVFVTGHTGYKGSWLIYWLCKLGATVTGYALPPVENALYNELEFRGLNDIRGDIRDRKHLQLALKQANPEVVFHLAAYANIYECIENPSDAFSVNVMGTVNLMEIVREFQDIKALICVTSDKVYYGVCNEDGFKEDEGLIGAIDPYSASKVAQEVIVESYKSTYLKNTGIATVRASNVLGPGDPLKDRLIPNMIDCFSRGQTVQLRSPHAIRPWQSVLDCLEGYLTVAQKVYESDNEYSGAWNIGPYLEGMKTVEWIARKMSLYWGQDAAYEAIEATSYIPEKDILRLNITKSIINLGWFPKWNLQDILKHIVIFEKDRIKGINLNKLYDDMINEHAKRDNYTKLEEEI